MHSPAALQHCSTPAPAPGPALPQQAVAGGQLAVAGGQQVVAGGQLAMAEGHQVVAGGQLAVAEGQQAVAEQALQSFQDLGTQAFQPSWLSCCLLQHHQTEAASSISKLCSHA